MRKLIILILFISGAANVSADCTQADLAGWWEFSAGTMSCSIFLDEEGAVTKGNCWTVSNGFLVSRLENKMSIVSQIQFDRDRTFVGREIRVGEHCKVKGSFTAGKPAVPTPSDLLTSADLVSGRINLEKTIVSGAAVVFDFTQQGPGQGIVSQNATYTMVKF